MSRMSRSVLAAFALFTAAVTVVVVVLAVSAGPYSGPAEAAPDSPPNVYAYMKVEFQGDDWSDTESRLVLMDGTEYIGGVHMILGDTPQFTHDGAYVYTRPILLDEITAVSVATGDEITVPCEGCDERFSGCSCSPIVPFGGSRIAWLDGDNRLVWADLAEEAPTVQTTETVLPTAPDAFEDDPLLVAGTDGLALAGYPNELRDPTPIYLVPMEGEPRLLDGIQPDSVDFALFSPDGSRLALSDKDRYTCTTVTVLDVASGAAETSPVSAAPGSACETKDVYVGSMWWDPDGTLNAYVQPDDAAADEHVHRRLEDGRWVDAAEGAGVATHRFDSGATVAVSSGAADVHKTLDQVLEFAFDGESERIDHSVNSIVVAPPGAADHR